MTLPSYRLFKMDPQSGRRGPGEWIEAADDDDALRLARDVVPAIKCEVWLQTRLVGIVRRDSSCAPVQHAIVEDADAKKTRP